VVAILTRKSMRSSTNAFLLALAIFDTIVLLCTLLLLCLETLDEIWRYKVVPHLVLYIYPVATIAQTVTIWITVSFTVERYIAVCHPLKASRMCTISKARKIIGLVVILSFLYNFSRWFEYRVDAITDHSSPNNTTRYTVVPTKFGENRLYEWIYYCGLYLPFMCIIPLIILAILNTLLVLAVRKSTRDRLTMGNTNHAQSKENNITMMLVSVVIVFIICQFPALIYNVALGVARPYVVQSEGWQILSIVRNFTVSCNSAVNFMLYCALGQRFRQVFLMTFCGSWYRKHGRARGTISASTNGLSRKSRLSDRNVISCSRYGTTYTTVPSDGDTAL